MDNRTLIVECFFYHLRITIDIGNYYSNYSSKTNNVHCSWRRKNLTNKALLNKAFP